MEYIPLVLAALIAVLTARKPFSKEIWYEAGRFIVLLWICSFYLHALYLCM